MLHHMISFEDAFDLIHYSMMSNAGKLVAFEYLIIMMEVLDVCLFTW